MDSQWLILKIIAGDFTTGFTVAFQVERWGQGGNRVCQKDVYGRLPAFSGFSESTATSPLGLDQLYGRWVGGITAARAGYAQRQRGLKIKSKQAIAARYEPLLDRQHQKALKQAMVQWLTTPTSEWQAIEKQLIRWLHSTPVETHVIIQLSQELYRESSQTADILAKLPWPEWPLFSEFQSPGNHPVYFAVNTYQYGAPSSLSLSRPSPQRSLRQSLSPRIRILHVMGHDDGINLEPDQAVLAQLTQTSPKGRYPFINKPHADVVSLRQPSYEILSQTLKDKRGFDLFVYSGHSEAFYDQDLAAMLLAEKDGVTIADLQLAFQRAIAAGLKIAIFNSCASSQLAEVLLDYGISTVISMKEEVPDTVAHRFLACFFQGYVQGGRSVLSSVKESLTALEEFERLYPGVGWLPIIHQNPALPPPLWRELRQKPQSLRYLGTVAAGAIILGLGLRFLGLSQGLDLKLFDVLVRTQPAVTNQDERLAVITINQDDLDILRQNGVQSSVGNDVISDGALAEVLTKIQGYNPRWIGLDVARDVPIATDQQSPLPSVFANGDRLLLSCGFPDQQGDELLPPPGINLENLTFINLPVDFDGVIRRQLLVADDFDTSTCPATQSLAFSLALNYLTEEGITPDAGATLTLNQKTFVPLGDRSGIYGGDQVGGYQILFRGYHRGTIREISLSTLYADQEARLDLADKLVLVGYGHKDQHSTVFGRDIPGVVIHAQMTKQILDTVLEDEPIYRFLPAWGEGVWILLWSGLGTGGLALILMGEGSRRQQQGLLIGLLLGATGSAWLALWGLGLWLPLSSPLLILGCLLGATLINDGDR